MPGVSLQTALKADSFSIRLVVSIVGWLAQVLVVVVALLPDIIAKYCYRTYFAKPEHIVRELDVGHGAGQLSVSCVKETTVAASTLACLSQVPQHSSSFFEFDATWQGSLNTAKSRSLQIGCRLQRR